MNWDKIMRYGWKIKRSCLLLVLGFNMIAGCTSEYSKSEETQDNELIIAWIDDKPITQTQLMKHIQFFLTEKGLDAPRSGRELKDIQQACLLDMARSIILDKEAKLRNIKLSEEELKTQAFLTRTKEIPEGFDPLIKDQEDWLKRVNRRLLSMKCAAEITQELSQRIVLTDEQISSAYQKNKDKYLVPMQMTIRVIRVYEEDLAKKIHRKLKQKWSFTKVAEWSTTMKGIGAKGEKHRIPIDDIPDEFVDKLKKLPLLHISDILKSEEKFYIYKVYERTPERILPLDEVKDILINELIAHERSKCFQEWMENQLRKTDIRVEALIDLQEIKNGFTNG